MFKNLNPGMIGVHASLAEALDMAAQYGFDGVDVNLPDVAAVVRETSVGEVRDLFEWAGSRPGNWGLPIKWHDAERDQAEELARLRRYAGLARDIGALRTTAVVMPWSDERTFDENYAFHVERLKPVAEILGEHGCRFGLEFIGPETLRRDKKHAFIYTMDGMLALCRDLGPNVGLLLDLWHWYTSRGTWDDLARLENDDVVNVHVNDAPAGIPADEQIDNEAVPARRDRCPRHSPVPQSAGRHRLRRTGHGRAIQRTGERPGPAGRPAGDVRSHASGMGIGRYRVVA